MRKPADIVASAQTALIEINEGLRACLTDHLFHDRCWWMYIGLLKMTDNDDLLASVIFAMMRAVPRQPIRNGQAVIVEKNKDLSFRVFRSDISRGRLTQVSRVENP